MTTGVAEPAPAPPVEAVPTKNTFQRVAGVLFAPVDTFLDIARRPDIVGPLLLILVIGYINTALMMPRMDWEAVAAQQAETMQKQNPNMSAEDAERAGRMGLAFGKAIGWIGPILGVIMFALMALILWGAFRLMGGEGTYAQAFSTVLYAWIPIVIFGIILAIVTLARGSIDPMAMATAVKSNPAFLVDMKEQALLFSLLTNFDIFTIWTVVLLIIGFAAVAKVSTAKSAAIVISLWVVLIVIKLGFAALGQLGAKA